MLNYCKGNDYFATNGCYNFFSRNSLKGTSSCIVEFVRLASQLLPPMSAMYFDIVISNMKSSFEAFPFGLVICLAVRLFHQNGL